MTTVMTGIYGGVLLGQAGVLGAAAPDLSAVQTQPAAGTDETAASADTSRELSEQAALLRGVLSGRWPPPERAAGFGVKINTDSLATIQKSLERRIKNPSPKKAQDLVPRFSFLGDWPEGNPFTIPPEKIEAAAGRFAREPVVRVVLPKEGRSIDIWTHHQRDGNWGLYYCSLPDKPRSRWSAWDRALFWHHIGELGNYRFTSGDTLCPLIQRMRLDPELHPEFRITAEKLLLELKDELPAVAAYRERMEKIPVLRRWLELKPYTRQVSLSIDAVRETMARFFEERMRDITGAVNKKLFSNEGPLPRRRREELDQALSELHFRLEPNPNGLFVKPPPITENWSYRSLKKFGDLLEKLKKRGYITREELRDCHQALLAGWQILNDYRLLAENGELTYTLSLWRRHPWFDEELGLKKVGVEYEDPGIQVLEARLPNGEVVGALVLCLFKWALRRNKSMVMLHSGLYAHSLEHWFRGAEWKLEKAMEELADEIRSDLQLGGLHCPPWMVSRAGWHTQPPLFPVTSPPETEAALQRLRKEHKHPDEALHGFLTGSYEALRRAEGASLLNPWLGGDLPSALQELVPRVIEPDPDPEKFDGHGWGYTTTGRSVDVYLGDQGYLTPDGTRWFHFNSVGVGQTLGVRASHDGRDGLLPLDEAVSRFYLTNLMHAVAGPFGFRTSLGAAVFNRGKDKNGSTNGVVHELRREQLRLEDLTKPRPFGGGYKQILDAVPQKIAREFGWKEFTREEYVRWFAGNLGVQFAIMEYFYFDHGVTNDGYAQLHPGNVSLVGEIFDFDCARFGPGARGARYLYNWSANEDHVDWSHIKSMQERWADPGNPNKVWDWLSVLLNEAPGFDFYHELKSAREAKLDELKKLGVDPRALIRKFNVEKWNPFMRSAGKKLRG